IDGQGTVMARRIVDALEAISENAVSGFTVSLDKDAPLDHPITVTDRHGSDFAAESLDGATIIVVDDVLNSGRTLLHAVAHLLPFRPRHIAMCVLVDRIHRRFPVRADYVGMSLSTNLKAHIDVRLSGPGPDEAVLMD
ncbi:MAG: phosphoribosyltransferase family protein, partial [Bacteroidota bacterium]|nr:phosphoribosyltransferase family protein [Bacteroidota bacterium]